MDLVWSVFAIIGILYTSLFLAWTVLLAVLVYKDRKQQKSKNSASDSLFASYPMADEEAAILRAQEFLRP